MVTYDLLDEKFTEIERKGLEYGFNTTTSNRF